jgi:3-oxoacyl-(acyl-carrier-protein) synthase
MLERGLLPATPEAGPVDPATPLDVVRPRPAGRPDLAVGVSLNLAFGGCNGALVFRRWAAA